MYVSVTQQKQINELIVIKAEVLAQLGQGLRLPISGFGINELCLGARTFSRRCLQCGL